MRQFLILLGTYCHLAEGRGGGVCYDQFSREWVALFPGIVWQMALYCGSTILDICHCKSMVMHLQ